MSQINRERERCAKACDVHLPYARSLDEQTGLAGNMIGAESLLIRIRNIIANGLEPVEFGEQMSQFCDDD